VGLPADDRASCVDDASPWETVGCVLCGNPQAWDVLVVPHPDAPDGRSAVVECRGCGLRRLSPRPTPSAIGGYYGTTHNAFIGRTRGPRLQATWNWLRDVASGAPSRPHRPWLRHFARPIAAWVFDITVPLDGPRPPRVIEIGSGYGDLLLYLQSRGCTVTGVDQSAQAAATAARLGVTVRHGTLAAQGFPDACFDTAILCHSLEHVPDPVQELREVARILRPGGTIHVAVPNGRAAGLHGEGLEWEHLSHPLHLWFFDATTLTRALIDAGFQIVRRPRAVSAHRRALRWAREMRRLGVRSATRRYLRYLGARLRHRGSGEVLRIVAVRP
jgi:SAM-dependent methyltransferase